MLEQVLSDHSAKFHSVVSFNPLQDVLLKMDFTQKNVALTDAILNSTSTFSDYVNELLEQAKATYGIGGYNEHRTIYSRSTVFNAADEPRRLHLGIDIWGDAGTEVMAPLDGIVHSFKYNDPYGDYGATIILQHQLGGVTFYTLYGHLALADIKDLQVGEHIAAGNSFAHFGPAEENGNWPPHLHFQIIKDMQGMRGDYPGVCKFSERDKFLENSPNADLILQMMQYAG